MRAAAQLSVLLICVALAGGAQAQELEIRGRVVDAEGTGAGGVELGLYPLLSPYEQGLLELGGTSLPNAVARAATDASGRYSLRAPEAGFWRLVASTSGSATMEYPFRREPLLEAVTLPDLELEPAREIQVTVERPNGERAAGAWIESWLSDDLVRRGRTTAWTPYTPPVRWTGETGGTVVVPAASEVELQAWEAGFRASDKVASRGDSTRLRLRSAIPRALVLTESDGDPLSDALLRVGDVEWPAGRSDAAGLVEVHGDAGQAVARVLTSDGRSVRVRLTGDEGRDGEPFVLRLPPLRTLGGLVLDAETRRPVADAFVYPRGAVGRSVRTDSRGGFALTLDAGEDRGVSAAASGYLTDGAVAAASAVDVTIALDPATDLSGRVFDGSGEPVVGAVILSRPQPEGGTHYRNLRAAGGRRALSDHSGSFLLPRLSRDVAHAVTARLEGFAPAEEIVRDVEARAAAGGVTLVLARGTALTGRVVAPDGRGVSGAALVVERVQDDAAMIYQRRGSGEPDPFRFELTTDREGEFVFGDTPPGDFSMEVRAPGFARLRLPVFEIEAGERTHDLGLVTLEAGVDLTGRIVDGDGVPLAGARITVSSRDDALFSARWPDRRTLSAADGSFTIADRRRGEFLDLEVELEGYASKSVPRVEVPAEAQFEIALEAGVTLSGRIDDPQGQPISGATISVSREGGGSSYGGRVYNRPEGWGRSDELGRFAVADLAPGRVRVQAEASGWLPTQVGDIELVVGSEPEALEIELQPGATVTGRVLGADGRPLSDAIVSVRDSDSFRFAGSSTDGNGNYTLGGVEPGLRRFAASHGGNESVQELEVEAGENRLDFYFEGGVEVSGTVVSPDGVPVEGATVSLTEAGTRAYRSLPSSSTDASGRFVLENVRPGSFQLAADHPGYGSTVLEEPVEVASAPLAGLVVRLAAGVTLRGTITGATPEDLVQLEVAAVNERAPIFKQGRVDSDAGYRVDNLSPGSWQVWAQSTSGRQTSGRLEIAEGETDVVLDLEFEEGLTLSGIVRKQGEPVAGAWLMVAGRDTGGGSSAQTDHEGRFRLTGLREGTYTLRVSVFDRGISHSEEVEILRDDEIVVELGGAAVAGRVADTRGGSLAGASLVLESRGDDEGGWRGLPQGATTDARGRYRIADVSPGSYRLRASKAGYATRNQALDLDDGALEEVDFTLEEVEGLSLRVLMATEAPAPSITYALRDLAGNVLQGGLESATSDGLVRLATVPDGDWELLVQAPGAAVRTLRTQAPREEVLVQLERAATVTVRVTELADDSSTVATLRVTGVEGLRHEAPGWNGEVQDSWRLYGGRHTLESLAAGRWIFSVTTTDGRSWERSARLDEGTNEDIVFD